MDRSDKKYSKTYRMNSPMHRPDSRYYDKQGHDCPGDCNHSRYDNSYSTRYPRPTPLRDYGPYPFVTNIEDATLKNEYYRRALWTGNYLQLTLMSIKVGGDIGLEVHPDLDQFIRIEEGHGIVKMGDERDCLDFQANVRDDDIFIIPAGKWHNLINTGKTPIKLYSIYAPPEHPHGTIHRTKEEAEAAERYHDH